MKKSMLSLVLFSIASSVANAQNVNTDDNKIAIGGYDVVNYFTTNSAKRGSETYATEHNGARYYFVDLANLEVFKQDPEAYLPQFGGYCSFAVGKMNQKVPVDPQTFRIDDGKLYLFYNDFWEGKPFNTIVPWLNNESEMEKQAAQNWKTLAHK